MKKFLLSIIFFVGVVSFGFGQTITTAQSGAWNDLNTWVGGVIPNDVNSSSIEINHDVTIENGSVIDADQITIEALISLTIEAGGVLNLQSSGSTDLNLNEDYIMFFQGANLIVNGTFNNFSTSSLNVGAGLSTISFNSGSVYNHGVNGLAIPSTGTSWDPNSTLQITGVTTTVPSGLNQSFGSIVYNSPGTSGGSKLLSLTSTTINGDLSILNTNSPNSVSFSSGLGNITIGGDLNVSGASRIIALNSVGTLNLTIKGDFNFASTGALSLLTISNASSILNFNINGDFTISNGVVQAYAVAGPVVNLNFNGGGVHIFDVYDGGLNATQNYNYSISASSIVNSGSSVFVGSGNFVLGSGCTLGTGNIVGVTIASSGTVQTSSRTFNTGSTIEYNGTSTQALGDGFPSTGVNLTINNTGGGVNMSSDLTISTGRTLTLTEGTLNIGDGNLLSLNGSVVTANGGISGGSLSNLTIGGTGAFGTLGFVGTQSLNDFTINRTSSGSITLGGDLEILGTLTQTAGDLNLNGNTLTLGGDFSQAGGTLNSTASSTFIIDGSGALPAALSFTGDVQKLRLDRSSATLNTTGSNFTLDTLELFSGTFDFSTSAVSIADGGYLERRDGGILVNALTAVGSYDLEYNNTAALTSGPELLSDASALNNIVKRGTGLLTISNDFTTNGSLTFSNGSFDAGTNIISLKGDLISNSGSALSDATITFDGTTNLSGSNTVTFGAITVNGIFNPTSNLKVNGDIINNGTLNSSGGTLTIDAASTLGGLNPITVNNFTIGASGVVTANASQALTVNGNINNAGSFDANGGTVIFGGITSFSGITPDFAKVQIDGTLNAPVALNLSGDLTNNGTFTHNDGLVRFTQAGTKTISGSATTAFYDLAVEGGTLNIDGTVDLENLMSFVGSPTVDFDGAGSGVFTLKSNASGDAAIGNIGSATISGEIIAERYITGGVGASSYHYMGSPIATTIADWQNEFYITGGFSDPSTGPGINPNTPSIYIYDESVIGGLNDKYVAYPTGSSADPIQLGIGYAVSLRAAQATTTATTKGAFHTGQATWNVTDQGGVDDGWNLIANQFPSAIDFDAAGWDKTDIENGFYVYNPASGNNLYYSSGVSAATDQYIALGQAFWVKATATSGTVTAQESVKYTGATPQFYRQKQQEKLRITLEGNDHSDNSYIVFNKEATDAYDAEFDFSNFRNDQHNISSLSTDGNDLKVNHVAATNAQNSCGKSISLFVRAENAGQFKLKFEELTSIHSTESIFLLDHFTDNSMKVVEGSTYAFDITADAASKGSERFELIFESKIPQTVQTVADNTCPNQDGEIRVKSSESFANYLIFKNDQLIVSGEGNGGNLRLAVGEQYLTDNLNEFTIKAFVGGCDTVAVGTAQIRVDQAISLDNAVRGSSVCNSSTQAAFNVATDLGTSYFILNNQDTVLSFVGTGKQYEGFIESEYLSSGLNEFTIAANREGCQSGILNQKLQINVQDIGIDKEIEFTTVDVCGINNNTSIEFKSQKGVEYEVYMRENLVNTVVGDGTSQLIEIDTEYLTLGANAFTITANYGECESYNFPGEIEINIFEGAVIEAITDQNICVGDKANIAIVANVPMSNYQLYIGEEIVEEGLETIISLSPEETTTYTLRGIAKNGCNAKTVHFTVEVSELARPGIIASGNVLESSVEGDAYQWYLNNEKLSTETGKLIVVSKSGDYTLEVMKGTCSNISDAYTFKEEILSANKALEDVIELYPNPVQDYLLIKSEKIDRIDLTIYTSSGKFIDRFVLNGGQTKIDMTKYSIGTYLIQLETQKGSITKRIVKQ